LENWHARTDTIPSATRVTKEKKSTKRKNRNDAKTRAGVIVPAWVASKIAPAGRIVIVAGTGQEHSPRSQGNKEPNYDTKYSIFHFAHGFRRGSLDERGTDAQAR
jgi:hypothetical protein